MMSTSDESAPSRPANPRALAAGKGSPPADATSLRWSDGIATCACKVSRRLLPFCGKPWPCCRKTQTMLAEAHPFSGTAHMLRGLAGWDYEWSACLRPASAGPRQCACCRSLWARQRCLLWCSSASHPTLRRPGCVLTTWSTLPEGYGMRSVGGSKNEWPAVMDGAGSPVR
jgi:hypothetical protein